MGNLKLFRQNEAAFAQRILILDRVFWPDGYIIFSTFGRFQQRNFALLSIIFAKVDSNFVNC